MRALIFVLTLSLPTGPLLADTSPQDLERLRRIMDEKLGSTRKPQPPQKPLKPEDFYVVKPGTQPSKRRGGSSEAPSESRGQMMALPGVAAAHASDGRIVSAQAGTGPAASHVKRDSYVIQLKTDLTAAQVDAALATLSSKYNLEIKKFNSSLGVLHVSPRSPTARGVAPESLGAALEPRIIADLRKEPFVDAAFVDFLVAPKALPRRVDTKIPWGATTFGWHWRTSGTDDGNWGLKAIRLPPVWTILNRVRKIEPGRPRTRMAFLDAGFGAHGHLTYNEILGGMPPQPALADCRYSHGTHVAGIAGALHGRGRGIDGIVPDSKIDAIPVSSEFLLDTTSIGVKNPVYHQSMLFSGAVETLSDYLDFSPPKPGERRVINVSLGYNWSALAFDFGVNPDTDDGVKSHILNTAKMVQRLASKVGETVLIVAAAGNDSEGTTTPDEAEWATPFGFAALHKSPTFKNSQNIMVVEATGRNGVRASFSNVGGHVSAPGVDVMSTLAGVSDAYGLCSGTSQATPHVTALAAILFELDPKKTPPEIAEIIRASAIPGPPGTAPRVDALAAVLKLSKDNSLRHLVDLDGNGKVDVGDLEIFKTHLFVLEDANRNGKPIAIDLNGDGNVDEYERCWPLIDFNGSGKASYEKADARLVDGQPSTDLQMLASAWTDTTKTFEAAMVEVGLDKLIAQWSSPLPGGSPLTASTKDPCN